jgi:hypothetical protein
MFKIIFTSDYEIHGNGDGCAFRLMVEPTERLMRLLEEYNSKLTLMADCAEIIKFRKYWEQNGQDDYHYVKIVEQLKRLIIRGHDVQLHLHSSYFNAKHDGHGWIQDWSEYNFARLEKSRAIEIVRMGKNFLESLLQPIDPNYKCKVFRAANWCVCPSKNVVEALVQNGIEIDTSVYKYGTREGLVHFNYEDAYSQFIPWRVDEDNMCKKGNNCSLFEIPIYSERRWIGAFATLQRFHRKIKSHSHPMDKAADKSTNISRRIAKYPPKFLYFASKRHAWKADFNQCGRRQLIKALQRADKAYSHADVDLPFVLIGHSKLFTKYNEYCLRPFLSFVTKMPQKFAFGKFGDLDLPEIEKWSAKYDHI